MDDIQQGPDIRADYERFNWKWLDGIKPDHWGALQQNLFILGMPNVVTPAHYDGLQNLFTQVCIPAASSILFVDNTGGVYAAILSLLYSEVL